MEEKTKSHSLLRTRTATTSLSGGLAVTTSRVDELARQRRLAGYVACRFVSWTIESAGRK